MLMFIQIPLVTWSPSSFVCSVLGYLKSDLTFRDLSLQNQGSLANRLCGVIFVAMPYATFGGHASIEVNTVLNQ